MQRQKATKPLFDNLIVDRFVTRAELARVFHVSTRTIDRMVQDGMPSHVFRGQRRFVCLEAIEWWRKEGR